MVTWSKIHPSTNIYLQLVPLPTYKQTILKKESLLHMSKYCNLPLIENSVVVVEIKLFGFGFIQATGLLQQRTSNNCHKHQKQVLITFNPMWKSYFVKKM